MKKIIKGILCIIVAFAALVFVGTLLSDSDTPNADSGDIQNGASVSTTEEQGDKLVYEDDYMKVWFVGAYEQPEIVADTCYFTLKVENKTDKQFTIYPMEASANDFMITILSGTPLTVNPGKTGQNAFFFSYNGFVDDISEINSIQFKASLMDENTSTIHEADIAFDF